MCIRDSITHYQLLLDYIKPDIVHVFYKGRIVKMCIRDRDTAKAVLNAPREMLIEKADLEENTVDDVLRVLELNLKSNSSVPARS